MNWQEYIGLYVWVPVCFLILGFWIYKFITEVKEATKDQRYLEDSNGHE